MNYSIKLNRLNKDLKELREICSHEHIIDANWPWRIGCIEPAEVCDGCGKLIRIKTFEIDENQ